MKPTLLILTIVIFTVLLAANCNRENENCHKGILIVNNSDNAIYFDESYRYPDTTLQEDGVERDPHVFKIENNSQKGCSQRDCYEGVLKSSYPIIMFFIYDAKTLETTPWDTVAKNYLILKRYDLSLEDLQGMNWTITYP